MWFVTRRDDIVRVLEDADTFTTAFEESPIRDVFGPQMLSTEGAVARSYKRRCTPPFTTVSVRANAAP